MTRGRGAARSGQQSLHRALHRYQARAPFHCRRSTQQSGRSDRASLHEQRRPPAERVSRGDRRPRTPGRNRSRSTKRRPITSSPVSVACRSRWRMSARRLRLSIFSDSAPMAPGSPAGWPDRSADWDGASALMKRIEWADAVGRGSAPGATPRSSLRNFWARREWRDPQRSPGRRAARRRYASDGRAGVHAAMSSMKRRDFLTAGALAAGGALLTSRLTFAGMANGGSRASSSSSFAGRSTDLPRCRPVATLTSEPARTIWRRSPPTDGGVLPLNGSSGCIPPLSFLRVVHRARAHRVSCDRKPLSGAVALRRAGRVGKWLPARTPRRAVG